MPFTNQPSSFSFVTLAANSDCTLSFNRISFFQRKPTHGEAESKTWYGPSIAKGTGRPNYFSRQLLKVCTYLLPEGQTVDLNARDEFSLSLSLSPTRTFSRTCRRKGPSFFYPDPGLALQTKSTVFPSICLLDSQVRQYLSGRMMHHGDWSSDHAFATWGTDRYRPTWTVWPN